VKRVVLVFSAAGLVPVKEFAEFSADQAGLASLTRTLAMELGPSVVVNAVSVGAYDAGKYVRTARFLTHTGSKRAARMSEITAAVLFLADPDNGYMTGHVLNVDGGWAVGYARNF
jgi:NAD(P)-dependent dehydrogenase (short-subunit alcohol dehydrogenase family)